METGEITRWFRGWRAQHPDADFMTALRALLTEHPEAGSHSAGTVSGCFALAAPSQHVDLLRGTPGSLNPYAVED
jgi:hypothetical protein